MRIKRLLTLTVAAIVMALISLVGIVTATNSTVVVTPTSPNGWTEQHATCGATATGSQSYVQGPENPPEGTGSHQFQIGPDGDSFEAIRNSSLNGVKLSDITALSYSTYVQQFGSGGQAPYIILNIDWDNNGTLDDQLFFEPVYQNGTYSGDPVPNQCGSNPACVVTGEWQEWDALIGGWWTETGGPPLVTLQSYIAAHPDARVLKTTSGLGSFRIATGCGGAAWANFIGNVDAVIIGFNGNTTTYDFELYNAPTSAAQCKNGGWQTFNPNRTAGPFKNQGDCIQYVNTGK
ncbi:MAG TPA: hypothetical protein VGB17_11925 [Pyrinomonadaceae bacterium]|jgi:hypothetical protein